MLVGRNVLVYGLLASLAILSGCASTGSMADTSAMARMDNAFTQAINTNHADAAAALYANDAIILPPNSPAVAGTDAIRQFWGGMLAAMPGARLELTSEERASAATSATSGARIGSWPRTARRSTMASTSISGDTGTGDGSSPATSTTATCRSPCRGTEASHRLVDYVIEPAVELRTLRWTSVHFAQLRPYPPHREPQGSRSARGAYRSLWTQWSKDQQGYTAGAGAAR